MVNTQHPSEFSNCKNVTIHSQTVTTNQYCHRICHRSDRHIIYEQIQVYQYYTQNNLAQTQVIDLFEAVINA
jgi:hypothetical protein